MAKTQTFFDKLQTAYMAALTADMSADHPRIQLHEDEIGTLVDILASCAAPLLEKAVVPTGGARKRALSVYQVWKSDPDVKAKFRQDYPGYNGPATNKQMGILWKALTESERQPFEERAAKLKEEFDAANPEDQAPAPKRTRTKKPKAADKSSSDTESKIDLPPPLELWIPYLAR